MDKRNYKIAYGILMVSSVLIFLLLSLLTTSKISKLNSEYESLLQMIPVAVSKKENSFNNVIKRLGEINNRLVINQNDFEKVTKTTKDSIADIKSRLESMNIRVLGLESSIREKEFIKNSTQEIRLVVNKIEQLNESEWLITYRTLEGTDELQITIDDSKTLFYIFDPYDGYYKFSDISMFNSRLQENTHFECKLYLSTEGEKMFVEVYYA